MINPALMNSGRMALGRGLWQCAIVLIPYIPSVFLSVMPVSLRKILWIVGLCLTIGGLVIAVILKNTGTENTAFLFIPLIGIILIMCLLFSGLIQDVVSDILVQVQQIKKTDEPPQEQKTTDSAEMKTAPSSNTDDGAAKDHI